MKVVVGLLMLLGLVQATAAQDKIVVSGASGQLGGLVVEELLARKVAPQNLILVSRTPDTLKRYAQRGASVRFGDFSKPESLLEAYKGGTRMLLISVNGGVSYGADAPFGGYKASGVGRQNGLEGFEQYLETKTIAIGIR